MSSQLIFILLLIAAILITSVTQIIRMKIYRHLGASRAKLIHLFVILVCLYYEIDTLISPLERKTIFAVFWLVIIFSQMYFYFSYKKE